MQQCAAKFAALDFRILNFTKGNYIVQAKPSAF
jgi:hypothetical protein